MNLAIRHLPESEALPIDGAVVVRLPANLTWDFVVGQRQGLVRPTLLRRFRQCSQRFREHLSNELGEADAALLGGAAVEVLDGVAEIFDHVPGALEVVVSRVQLSRPAVVDVRQDFARLRNVTDRAIVDVDVGAVAARLFPAILQGVDVDGTGGIVAAMDFAATFTTPLLAGITAMIAEWLSVGGKPEHVSGVRVWKDHRHRGSSSG